MKRTITLTLTQQQYVALQVAVQTRQEDIAASGGSEDKILTRASKILSEAWFRRQC